MKSSLQNQSSNLAFTLQNRLLNWRFGAYHVLEKEIFMYVCVYIYIYVKIYAVEPLYPTSSTYRPLPYIDRFIWFPNIRPYNTIVTLF